MKTLLSFELVQLKPEVLLLKCSLDTGLQKGTKDLSTTAIFTNIVLLFCLNIEQRALVITGEMLGQLLTVLCMLCSLFSLLILGFNPSGDYQVLLQ